MDAFETDLRIDLGRTFGFLRMGSADPTCTRTAASFTKTFAVDEHSLVRHTVSVADGRLRVTVEGDGSAACWRAAVEASAADGDDSFAARREHLALRYMVRELGGLRFIRVPWLFDLACAIVLQQRVTYEEALGEYRRIVERFGTTHPALGTAFPAALRLARAAPAQLQALGIDAQRASTLVRLAREHAVHQVCDDPDLDAMEARLRALPGIGPWTTGMLRAYGAGDPDAIPLGDLHLPHTIAEVLAGERRATDERMLALLAPYAGQRARVIRLIMTAKFQAPALLRRR